MYATLPKYRYVEKTGARATKARSYMQLTVRGRRATCYCSTRPTRPRGSNNYKHVRLFNYIAAARRRAARTADVVNLSATARKCRVTAASDTVYN